MKPNLVSQRLMLSTALGFFLFTLFAWNPPEASAIPAFARKYDMDCSHCHTSAPQLTEFGRKFVDNGFQMKGLEQELKEELRERVRKEDPEEIHPAYWPFSLRTQAGYQYLSRTHQDVSGADRTVSTSSFGVRRLWLMAGGLLTPGVSFFANFTPHLEENVGFAGNAQEGELHLGWIRYTHQFTGGAANVKLGLMNLDLVVQPLDHQRITVAPYEILEYIPPSAVGDHVNSLGDHQLGLELLGRYSDGFRYAFAVLNGHKGERDNNRVVDLYARVSQSLMGQSLGVFGYWGQAPTEELSGFAGTGRNNEPYYRYGGDLDLRMGDLTLVGLYLYGQDDRDLFTGTPQDAKFHGGFVEANFYVKPADLMVVWRYDIVRNIHQGNNALAEEESDMDRYTLAFRHNTLLTNRVGLSPHLEYSYKKTQRSGINDRDVMENRVFAAMDFAF